MLSFLSLFVQVECRLQLEAQRISLSQMHAAQLELLREQTDARVSTLEQELGFLKKTYKGMCVVLSAGRCMDGLLSGGGVEVGIWQVCLCGRKPCGG